MASFREWAAWRLPEQARAGPQPHAHFVVTHDFMDHGKVLIAIPIEVPDYQGTGKFRYMEIGELCKPSPSRLNAQQHRYRTVVGVCDGEVLNAIPVEVSHHQRTGTRSHRKRTSRGRLERAVASPQQHRYVADKVCHGQILNAVSVEVSHYHG